MNQERFKEIRARCNAATGGIWDYSVDSVDGRPRTLAAIVDGEDFDIAIFEQWDASPYEEEMVANADFIAHARQDLPDCTAEIERLQGMVKAAYYESANEARIPIHVYCLDEDKYRWMHSKARKALEE